MRFAALLAAVMAGGCAGQAGVPKAPAGEVYIPGGTFEMGHAPLRSTQCGSFAGPVTCGSDGLPDFAPAHAVTLSPYFIDVYEVTFGDYRKCMDAGSCGVPWEPTSLVPDLEKKMADPTHAHYPIYGVTPEAAARYCAWKAERLPTEAEWERAARGPNDYDYRWGNDPPTCAKDNDWAQGCVPPSSDWMRPVGSDPRDVSTEGVHDLYGNAFELVADLYLGSYYVHSPQHDPTGPKASDIPPGTANPNAHVERGRCDGIDWPGYDYVHNGCPVWFRTADPGGGESGFRCAKDAP